MSQFIMTLKIKQKEGGKQKEFICYYWRRLLITTLYSERRDRVRQKLCTYRRNGGSSPEEGGKLFFTDGCYFIYKEIGSFFKSPNSNEITNYMQQLLMDMRTTG